MKKTFRDEEFQDGIFLLAPSHPILCTTKNADASDHDGES